MEALVEIIRSLDAPTIVLVFMMLVALLAAEKAQQRDGFDWAEILREGEKLSWKNLGGIVSIGITSWVLIYVFMNGMRTTDNADDLVKILHELFWYYALFMAVWAMGPAFVEKMADALIAKYAPRAITSSSSVTPAGVTTATADVPAPVVPQPVK